MSSNQKFVQKKKRNPKTEQRKQAKKLEKEATKRKQIEAFEGLSNEFVSITVRRVRYLTKKLKQIEGIEAKIKNGEAVQPEERIALENRENTRASIAELERLCYQFKEYAWETNESAVREAAEKQKVLEKQQKQEAHELVKAQKLSEEKERSKPAAATQTNDDEAPQASVLLELLHVSRFLDHLAEPVKRSLLGQVRRDLSINLDDFGAISHLTSSLTGASNLIPRFRDCYLEAVRLWGELGDQPNETISGTRVTFNRLSEVLNAVRKTPFYSNGALSDEQSPPEQSQQQQHQQQRSVHPDMDEMIQQQQKQQQQQQQQSLVDSRLLAAQNHIDGRVNVEFQQQQHGTSAPIQSSPRIHSDINFKVPDSVNQLNRLTPSHLDASNHSPLQSPQAGPVAALSPSLVPTAVLPLIQRQPSPPNNGAQKQFVSSARSGQSPPPKTAWGSSDHPQQEPNDFQLQSETITVPSNGFSTAPSKNIAGENEITTYGLPPWGETEEDENTSPDPTNPWLERENNQKQMNSQSQTVLANASADLTQTQPTAVKSRRNVWGTGVPVWSFQQSQPQQQQQPQQQAEQPQQPLKTQPRPVQASSQNDPQRRGGRGGGRNSRGQRRGRSGRGRGFNRGGGGGGGQRDGGANRSRNRGGSQRRGYRGNGNDQGQQPQYRPQAEQQQQQ